MTDPPPLWLVLNRETRIIVSRWYHEECAWVDKDRLDARYEAIQPRSKSPLVVERES